MKYFPIFLDLAKGPVVLAGGGEEIVRKARLFAKAARALHVIAPGLPEELAGLPNLRWIAKEFAPSLLDGASLVCAAHPAWNSDVSASAQARGIPVNVVDRPELSSFLVPAIVDRDPVVVAIGTEGAAPVLGQGLRARIDALLPHSLGALAAKAESLRATVAKTIPAGAARRSFWQRFFFGDAGEAFHAGETARFTQLLNRLLSRAATPAEGRIAFVSTGGDDPELLTLMGQRKLMDADLIIRNADVVDAFLEQARRDATWRFASPNFVTTTDALLAAARAGLRVVRLVRGAVPAEEYANLAAEGIAVEAVPGVGIESNASILPFATATLRLAA